MDPNKIFGLFDNAESSKEEVVDKQELIANYKKHPLFWIGMFKKLLSYRKHFKNKGMVFFMDLDTILSYKQNKLDLQEISHAGDYMVYIKAWEWISKIDIDNDVHKDSLIYMCEPSLISYIDELILFFESYEEYEKCMFLKNIQNFFEENLENQE